MQFDLKFNYTEIGYCQVHYTYKNSIGQKVHYCLMEEYDDVVALYKTTPDGEADYMVNLKEGAIVNFEIPPDDYGRKLLKSWEKGLLVKEFHLKYNYTKDEKVYYTCDADGWQTDEYYLMELLSGTVVLYKTSPERKVDCPIAIGKNTTLILETPPDEHGKNLLKSWQEETLK